MSAFPEGILLRSAFLESFAAMSAVPPMPKPTITGGHGFPPADATDSRTNLVIPETPSDGFSMQRRDIFSDPAPLGKTVISR